MLKENENIYPHRNLYMNVYCLFIIVKKEKQLKDSLADGQIMMYTIEYYSAMKRNQVLINATAWMNLKNITVSERSQTQKVTYCMTPFI